MRIRAGLLTVLGVTIALAWPAAGQTFNSRVRPFLAKNCTGCHNAKLNTSNLNLESFTDEATAATKTELWDKVRDKLVTGKMPPPPAPAPAKEDIAAVTTWIDGVLKASGLRR